MSNILRKMSGSRRALIEEVLLMKRGELSELEKRNPGHDFLFSFETLRVIRLYEESYKERATEPLRSSYVERKRTSDILKKGLTPIADHEVS